jgi:hypothetical protein
MYFAWEWQIQRNTVDYTELWELLVSCYDFTEKSLLYTWTVCNPFIWHTGNSLRCKCDKCLSGPIDTFFFFLILHLFPLTAQRDSGEFSGVVNCAAILAKLRRQLSLSNIKKPLMCRHQINSKEVRDLVTSQVRLVN